MDTTKAGATVLGYGMASLAGALAASECDIVAFMEGDGADKVENMEELLRPIGMRPAKATG